MSNFDLLNKFSILPIIDLKNLGKPKNGFFITAPDDCTSNICKGNYCKDFYEKLKTLKDGSFIECPNGFTSYVVEKDNINFALTGFIPFPRMGSDNEKKNSKKYPDNKISREKVIEYANTIVDLFNYFIQFEKDIIDNSSKALHEIRKLNMNVKQTAERLSKDDPTNKKLLTIYKASEMMSQQFNVIEILANEKLSELELNTDSQIFDLIYKCIHINSIDKDRIDLICQPSYRPRAKVNDKTFSILPNVLVGNATKYSKANTRIKVHIIEDGDYCIVKVVNEIKEKYELDKSVFEKGIRFHKDSEGTGKGLYVARLVALQHNTDIEYKEWVENGKKNMIGFSFNLKTLD